MLGRTDCSLQGLRHTRGNDDRGDGLYASAAENSIITAICLGSRRVLIQHGIFRDLQVSVEVDNATPVPTVDFE